MKTYKDQESVINRLFIDDWTRRGLAYETFFEGDEYHVVKKKNGPGLEIIVNDRNTKLPCE